MRKIFLLVLINIIFIFYYSFCQTYRNAFDRYEAVDHDYSYDININGWLNSAESYVLESYIMMWKATQDKKYLNKFIIHSKRLQDHRDDKVATNLYGVNGTSCSVLYSYPHDNFPVWSFDDGCSQWIPRVLHSGNIIYPMAEFIYLMLQDPQTSLETVPNEVGLSSVSSFLDYAYWLRSRVIETINFHQLNWSCYDVAYHTNWWTVTGVNSCVNTSDKDALNMQCAMGRALIMMFLVETSPNNVNADNGIIELCSNHLTNIAHLVREELNEYNSDFYTWSHNYNHTIIEDVGGHANLIMEFADLCYTYDIRDFYDSNLKLFTLTDMEKFGRTFAEHIYQSPLNFANNTFGTSAGANQSEPYHSGLYVFLSKYNRYVYQQISDYFCYQALNNTGSLSIGFAELALYETLTSVNGLPINIFNPIAVDRLFNAPDIFLSCAKGDFDDDGNDEIIFPWTDRILMFSFDNNRKLVFEAITQTQTISDINGIAVGHIGGSQNNLIVGISKDLSRIYLYKKNASNIEILTADVSLHGNVISSITVGDYDSNYPGDEIAIYSSTNGKIYLFSYNGSSIIPILLNNNFLGYQVTGMATGKFDSNNSDQIAVVNNLNGKLQIINFQSGNVNLLYEYTQTAGFNNLWNGVTAGDFDGDGLDEIIAHRDYDGQFLIFKVKNGQVVNEYGEYFPIDQKNGIFCSAHLNQMPYKDALVSFRNYDGQITVFNMNGLCQGIDLENITISDASSIDNPYFTTLTGTNDYTIDYHSPNSIVAGNNFKVDAGGKATLVSGKEIILKPGFSAESGSDFHAYIDDVNFNCGNHELFKIRNSSNPKFTILDKINPGIKVIPNPNNGVFSLEIDNFNLVKEIFVEDVFGRQIFHCNKVNLPSINIDISNHHKGVYFIKIISEGNECFDFKIIFT